MSMMTPEGEARARAEYEEAQRANRASADQCRYCKSMRTRARSVLTRRGEQWAAQNPETYERMLKNAEVAMCKAHVLRSHLNFTTSPISETYWSS